MVLFATMPTEGYIPGRFVGGGARSQVFGVEPPFRAVLSNSSATTRAKTKGAGGNKTRVHSLERWGRGNLESGETNNSGMRGATGEKQ